MRNSRIGLIGLLAVAGLCQAEDRGTIRGVVTDPSGGAVPSPAASEPAVL